MKLWLKKSSNQYPISKLGTYCPNFHLVKKIIKKALELQSWKTPAFRVWCTYFTRCRSVYSDRIFFYFFKLSGSVKVKLELSIPVQRLHFAPFSLTTHRCPIVCLFDILGTSWMFGTSQLNFAFGSLCKSEKFWFIAWDSIFFPKEKLYFLSF